MEYAFQGLPQIYTHGPAKKNPDIVNKNFTRDSIPQLCGVYGIEKKERLHMSRLTLRFAFGSIALLTLAACSGDSAPAPDQTMQQFMANEVQVTADIYWGAVGSVSELIEGEPVFREYQPETDEEWAAIAAAAAKLREQGELLATAAYSADRDDDWLVFAQGMQDSAGRAEQAALAKDREAVFEAGGIVYNVCTACHQVYPPANLPDGFSEADLRPTQDATLEQYRTQ